MTEEPYWIHKDGATTGPFEARQVIEAFESNSVLHSDLVHHSELGGWVSVGVFSEKVKLALINTESLVNLDQNTEEKNLDVSSSVETGEEEDVDRPEDMDDVGIANIDNGIVEFPTPGEEIIITGEPINIEATKFEDTIEVLGEIYTRAKTQRYIYEKDLAVLHVINKNGSEGKKIIAKMSCFDKKSPLFRDENVLILYSAGSDGNHRATKVLRNERWNGIVARWLDERSFGFIKLEDDTEVFAHYTEIKATGPRFLIEGEAVHFHLTSDEGGKQRALNIHVSQSRFAIERFANMDRFASGGLIKRLASLAIPEDWSYRKNSKLELPVLHGYVYYTFDRLMVEDKIAVGVHEGKGLACFNTGLVTPQFEPIYGLFEEYRPNRQDALAPKWSLSHFVTTSDRRLKTIGKLPDIANYFSDPAGLIFDASRDLRMDFDHIIDDNNKRFPIQFRDNRHKLRTALMGAKDIAIQRVKRNYKTAIPQFYKGKMQLLLPLCLESANTAELALVVDRDGEVYIGSTILSLEDAYNNARLIACPDREWLQP